MSRHGLSLALTLLLFVSGCTFWRIVAHGPSDIDDYKIFPGRELAASAHPVPFKDDRAANRLPRTLNVEGLGTIAIESFISHHGTAAFLVVHDGDLVYEYYGEGYARDSLVQVFSVTKSVTSLLIGCAIRDGLIKSVDQPVTDFVPELRKNGFDAVKIGHLLQMTSGIDYKESDNPFGRHPAMYYGTDIVPSLLSFRLKEKPGTRYEYRSSDAQLLGLVLMRALKGETVTSYLQRTLWEPLGMEYGGTFATDRPDGIEKTFCCLSMRAVDLAKIGMMAARGGRVGGREVVPESWMIKSRTPVTTEGGAPFYHYLWWMPPELKNGFMASGHRGQYLIILPESRLVVVRLGTHGGEDLRRDYIRLAQAVAGLLSF